MSEQDSLSTSSSVDAYYGGIASGYVGVKPEEVYWKPPQAGENRFDLYTNVDQLPSVPPSVAFQVGLLRGAAFGLNEAVHSAIVQEGAERPGQLVDERGALVNAANYVAGLVEKARSTVREQDLTELWREPAVKEIIPEIAMTELYGDFGNIHDARVPGGITRQELQTYADHCGEGRELEKLVVDYALSHFDKISHLDGDSTDITKSALEKGLKIFSDAEIGKVELAMHSRPDEAVLHFLDANFDKIRDPKFPGISQFDLRRYFSQNCNNELERSVLDKFNDIRDLDQADGDRDWHYLWLTRNNSDDITRSDVSTGLASIAKDRARSEAIQATFADWAK